MTIFFISPTTQNHLLHTCNNVLYVIQWKYIIVRLFIHTSKHQQIASNTSKRKVTEIIKNCSIL